MLVLLASLFVIVVTGYHWWLSSRVQSRLAQVRAEHEPVTLPELNRYYAEVPEPSNAAVAYGRAFGLLQKTKSFQTLEHVYELPSGSGPLPADARQVMEKACQENAETFGALSEGNKLKSCRYPVDYTPGWAALLPHLRHLTKCSALEMYRGVLG